MTEQIYGNYCRAMKNNLYIASLNLNIMAQTTAIKHADVNGKELFYLRISNGSEQVMVNVGKSTYDKVLALDQQGELPLNNNSDEKAKVDNTDKRKR